VLMKAEGTGPLFDIDNVLRVFECSPNLWQTTIEKDSPQVFEGSAPHLPCPAKACLGRPSCQSKEYDNWSDSCCLVRVFGLEVA
jgi:hypothetical protein